MSSPDFKQNYFELFGLPVSFDVDAAALGARYRKLQAEMHPDRFAGASDLEQRLAVQYSSRVNEAYATLRKPLPRALYLLELAGVSAEEVASQRVDGGFLMMQMELREKLESMHELIDPDTVLDHLLTEIEGDLREVRAIFAAAYAAGDHPAAAVACVKMQYLYKLQSEAEQLESDLLEKGV
ncbi:MAG: Fe-S protein assembly co-chaperone HscB [Halioglobus sp.]|nr:Fe-S protein assembly co-chaperone HscB [Halioglobus sp.]